MVVDTATGSAKYDNYGGRWGAQKEFDAFLQAYAVEKAKLEARKPAAAERAIRSHFERALSWLQAEGERTPPA